LAEEKTHKKGTDDLTVFFTLSGSVSVKAAHKTLVKLTPDEDSFQSISTYRDGIYYRVALFGDIFHLKEKHF